MCPIGLSVRPIGLSRGSFGLSGSPIGLSGGKKLIYLSPAEAGVWDELGKKGGITILIQLYVEDAQP